MQNSLAGMVYHKTLMVHGNQISLFEHLQLRKNLRIYISCLENRAPEIQ